MAMEQLVKQTDIAIWPNRVPVSFPMLGECRNITPYKASIFGLRETKSLPIRAVFVYSHTKINRDEHSKIKRHDNRNHGWIVGCSIKMQRGANAVYIDHMQSATTPGTDYIRAEGNYQSGLTEPRTY